MAISPFICFCFFFRFSFVVYFVYSIVASVSLVGFLFVSSVSSTLAFWEQLPNELRIRVSLSLMQDLVQTAHAIFGLKNFLSSWASLYILALRLYFFLLVFFVTLWNSAIQSIRRLSERGRFFFFLTTRINDRNEHSRFTGPGSQKRMGWERMIMQCRWFSFHFFFKCNGRELMDCK